MKGMLRFAPSPAMVVSCIALLVALGGVGYAATALPRNSVGTPQLKRNAVTSVKVKDRSLLARDFRRGQLPRGLRGLTGATGAAGAAGAKGDKGDLGPTAARVVNSPASVALTGTEQAVVDLASINSQGDQQITTTVPSTIMGTAMIRFSVTAASASNCRLYISDGTGPTNGLTLMQQSLVTRNDHAGAGFATISYIGAATKPAGTYNVRVHCTELVATVATSQLHQLQVWAVGS
jgi:hypothetical protein